MPVSASLMLVTGWHPLIASPTAAKAAARKGMVRCSDTRSQTYSRVKKLAIFFRNSATQDRAAGEVRTRRETGQSLVSVAKGDKTRTFREPKLTITASSSSTKTTWPRPNLSWVT